MMKVIVFNEDLIDNRDGIMVAKKYTPYVITIHTEEIWYFKGEVGLAGIDKKLEGTLYSTGDIG